MDHAADFARRPFLDRVLAPARYGWTAYWQRRAARATVAMLHALDDRALEDIGMDRSEIESVVHGGGGRRIDMCGRSPSSLPEPRIGGRGREQAVGSSDSVAALSFGSVSSRHLLPGSRAEHMPSK